LVLLIVGSSVGYFFYSRAKASRPAISQPAQGSIPYNAPKPQPVLKPPTLVRSIPPHRGGMLWWGKAKGEVRLMATIDAEGRVEKVDYISGPDKLVEEAEKTAMQWIFDPATQDGQPVEGTIPITVEFGKP
jgi:TonB family protein